MAKKSYGRGGSDDDEDEDTGKEAEAAEATEGEAPKGPPSGVKGNLTEKSVTVGVDKPEGIAAGMVVGGEGIEYGSTVIRVDGNGIVLDKAATVTKEGVDLSFAGPAV